MLHLLNAVFVHGGGGTPLLKKRILHDIVLQKLNFCIIFACRFQKFVTMGQSTISIRVDEKLKKSFDELCDSVGLSNTAAFTVFMKAAVRERRIPFELRAETEAEIRAKSMEAFEEMRRIARQKGISGMSLEEINEEIRLARRGE